MQNAIAPANIEVLTDALPEDAVQEWLADEPADTGDLISDRVRYRTFWQGAEHLIDMMPDKAARQDPILTAARISRSIRTWLIRSRIRCCITFGKVTKKIDELRALETEGPGVTEILVLTSRRPRELTSALPERRKPEGGSSVSGR